MFQRRVARDASVDTKGHINYIKSRSATRRWEHQREIELWSAIIPLFCNVFSNLVDFRSCFPLSAITNLCRRALESKHGRRRPCKGILSWKRSSLRLFSQLTKAKHFRTISWILMISIDSPRSREKSSKMVNAADTKVFLIWVFCSWGFLRSFVGNYDFEKTVQYYAFERPHMKKPANSCVLLTLRL